MKNKLRYTFQRDLKERLRDPIFKKEWDNSTLEYQLARALIKKRLSSNLTQRELAKRAQTTQVVISRIETMKANPSINLLKRIAKALEGHLTFKFN